VLSLLLKSVLLELFIQEKVVGDLLYLQLSQNTTRTLFQ